MHWGAKPTNDRSGQLSELYPLQQSLLPKNWKFIPEKLKGNRISFQPQKLKTGCKNFNNNIKNKNLNKGPSNDINGLEIYPQWLYVWLETRRTRLSSNVSDWSPSKVMAGCKIVQDRRAVFSLILQVSSLIWSVAYHKCWIPAKNIYVASIRI